MNNISKDDVDVINEINNLKKETERAEQELLVKHNKNVAKDLRIFLKCKRKLATLINETDI
ncbi:MAG: hypothetical protein IJZ26_01905 [Clostridia bacterium]|nr:hypothetical protein [Clostridia bacterium]